MADHGAAWTVSEMASAKALNFGDRKSLELLKDEHPHGLYAIQLFGAEPESMAKAILFVREKGIRFDILDINMGCPAPKITSSGAGSKLLLDPPLCGQMAAAARKALGDDTPADRENAHRLGCRQPDRRRGRQAAGSGRRGFDCRAWPHAGANVHPAHRYGSHRGHQAGGVHPGAGERRRDQRRRCAYLVKRDRLRRCHDRARPWATPGCSHRCARALLGEERPPEPTLNQRMAALRADLRNVRGKGEWAAMPQARSQAMHYMKGLRGAAALRRYCSMLEHFTDVDRLIDAVYKLQ